MALTLPVRRSNIIVRDMERSLGFYRDVLGWDVFHDGGQQPSSTGEIFGVRCSALHIVVVRAGEADIGMIGLMQLLDPDPPLDTPIPSGPARAGEIYLFMATTEFDEVYGRTAGAGMELAMPISPRAQAGEGPREFGVRDPDGVIVTFIDRTWRRPVIAE